MDTTSLIDILHEAVPGAAAAEAPAIDMPTIVVDRERIADVCRALRDHRLLQFALMVDVTAVDYLPAAPRFEVVYHLACLGSAYQTGPSAAPASRLRIKVRVPGEDARLPTVVPIYPAAGWLEREVFDLFGIVFEGHPDLRRLLMPEDWQGYPLRKDYPVQIRKDTVSWEPVQLSAAEFAESLRAAREQAERIAQGGPAPAGGPARRD